MISICMITKNEENNLEECLKRLEGLEYEIIVVDTGSSDSSKDIASKYTNHVYDFQWCDDFSAARNFSISKATNDIVFIIDSDEFVLDFDKNAVEKIFKSNEKVIGRILRKEHFGVAEQNNSQNYINRVFSKKYFHYEGRIHEQIVPNIEENIKIVGANEKFGDRKKEFNYETIILPISVDHSGYTGNEVRESKAQRNISLLLKELELKEDPYILYQLGKSYYMISDYEKAKSYFSKGLQFDLDPKLEYVVDMVETYGYSLLNTKEFDKALLFENIYNDFETSADFQFLMGLIYMNNGLFENAINEFEKAVSKSVSRVEGVNSYQSWYNIGVIYECLGYKDQAITYYKKCDGYEKAMHRLQDLK